MNDALGSLLDTRGADFVTTQCDFSFVIFLLYMLVAHLNITNHIYNGNSNIKRVSIYFLRPLIGHGDESLGKLCVDSSSN